MTFEELLQACALGKLPEVTYFGTPGRVTCIKDQADRTTFKGCAVKLVNLPYDSWFYAQDGHDGRCKYMRDLKLKTNEHI